MITFSIVDVGGIVRGTISRDGVTITANGGCPAQQILGRIRNFSDPGRLAKTILRRWMEFGDGYEGGILAAQENRLYVSVNNDEVRLYA
jgi:hypothetical protein